MHYNALSSFSTRFHRSKLSTLDHELFSVSQLIEKPARIKVNAEAVVDHRMVCASCNLEERGAAVRPR
jgi:hypothetical protein